MRVTDAARIRLPGAFFVIAATSVATTLLYWARGLLIDVQEVNVVLIAFSFVVIVGYIFQLRGRGRIGIALELMPLFLLVSLSFTLLGIGLAASQRQLADSALAHADQALFPFFNWPDVTRSVGQRVTWWTTIINFSYSSMSWQAPLVIVLGSLSNNRQACNRFIVMWSLALSMTMCVHSFFPASGAFSYYSIPHAEVPGIHANVGWTQPQLIAELRSGIIRTVGWSTLEGLVSFPSFHAAAAVLLTRSFWSYKVVRWPFVLLNGLMILAAVPCGGHYLIDIIAGILLAIATLLVVEGYGQTALKIVARHKGRLGEETWLVPGMTAR